MQIEFKATKRVEQGTGASRRLRRAGQLPGIIYGGTQDAKAITLDHNELFHLLRRDVFHSSVLSANVDGKKEAVILRAAQWHPYKPQVLHLDFQRVSATEKVTLKVPLHFINGENSPAVKLASQIISHVITEIEVACLPKDLPEHLEIDLGHLEADQAVHISEIKLPEGVEIIHHGEDDAIAITVKTGGGEDEDDAEGEEGASEADQE